MTAVFLKLVNMSITASWLVLAVIAIRLVLKKAPKAIHCALWTLVAIRLICPFSLESPMSLIPERPDVTVSSFQPEISETVHAFSASLNPAVSEIPDLSPASAVLPTASGTQTQAAGTILPKLTAVWFTGMSLMNLYALHCCRKIHRKVAPSICIGNNIWICDHIDSPFILGIFRPRIFLPSVLESRDADFVLAHERAHLKRKDHWWKPIGFVLLSVYWFNPVIWAAYILLCRDIELACDEKVIKEMALPEKKAYSTALLNCSLPRHMIAACPLAFGEVGVKERVKNVLHYKKPAFWIILLAVALCIAAAVCLLTDPSAGMYLYEIDDSRNYSDLFTVTDDIFLTREGEVFPVAYPETLLNVLDDITVREQPLDRSRVETRDKTHQVHIRRSTYLNFSRNFTQVWIDNGVKATFTYRVRDPGKIRSLFEIITGECIAAAAEDATPTGVTVVYTPKKAYDSENLLIDGDYWLESWDGEGWIPVERLPGSDIQKVNVRMDAKDQDRYMLNWNAVYGALPDGKYRIGALFFFQDAGIATNIYAGFTIEAASYATFWFDNPKSAENNSPLPGSTFPLPGAEEITLTHSAKDHQISMNTEDGSEVIVTGWPIQTAAFLDLTGDGVAELCCTVLEGFGMIDSRIRVYDCMEKQLYELEDRGTSNYELSIRSNRIIIAQSDYITGNVLDVGLLAMTADGTGLGMEPLDNSFREELNVKHSGATSGNCSWDISAVAHIENNWDQYRYLVCHDFDSRFVSLFDPQITGNDLIVGVRYDGDKLGAAWFEKAGGDYQYRRGFDSSEFTAGGKGHLSVPVLTNENSYTVYLTADGFMTATSREAECLQILLNSGMDNINWNLPEAVLKENYNYFDPQYVGNSLFLGAYKGDSYRVLHFEKNETGQYDYQDICHFLPEMILVGPEASLPVSRIETADGQLHVVLITDESITGIYHDDRYIRLTQRPSILVLDPGEAAKLYMTLPDDVPTIMDVSFDAAGTPVFGETDFPGEDTFYFYGCTTSYYDGWNRPGCFFPVRTEVEQMADILTSLPENALVPWKQEVMDPFYVVLNLRASSGERYAEPVDYLFSHMGDYVLLTINSGREADHYFRIDDNRLKDFLAGLCDPSRYDAGTVVQNEKERVTYSHGNVTIQLVPYWNWEYEIVEYTDGETPFGIRGRPINQDSGWIFYSCWPGGFTTDTTEYMESNRNCTLADGSDWTVEYTCHYPDDPVMLTPNWRLWSSMEITGIPGNFAIINEGAGNWFYDHRYEIDFGWDNNTFQIIS